MRRACITVSRYEIMFCGGNRLLLLLWIQTSARLKGERRCARETDAKSRVLQVLYDKVRRRFSMVGRPRRAFSTVQREKMNFPQRNRANRNKSAEDISRKRKKKLTVFISERNVLDVHAFFSLTVRFFYFVHEFVAESVCACVYERETIALSRAAHDRVTFKG